MLLLNTGLCMLRVSILSAAFIWVFILNPLDLKSYAFITVITIDRSQIVLNLISPPIIRQILQNFGWFWLFCSISIVNCLGTVVLLFLKDAR